MLSAFRLAHYRLTLEALDALHLPPFKGSALRGGFGSLGVNIAHSADFNIVFHLKKIAHKAVTTSTHSNYSDTDLFNRR